MRAKNFLRRIALLPYQLLVILVFFVVTLVCGLGSSLASLFDSSGNKGHRWLTCWAKANLALAGLRIEIQGLERLDPGATYVFMLNHSSFLDILLAFAYIPHNFRIITKEEIFWMPLMGWALRRSGQIPMNRTNPRKGLESLRHASELLRKRISIVVFPEGTRSLDGAIKDFKATLFILPIRACIPVVPVFIKGTFEALTRGSILLKPVPLKLTFHDPIPAGSFNSDRDRWLFAKKVHEVLSSSQKAEPVDFCDRSATTPSELQP